MKKKLTILCLCAFFICSMQKLNAQIQVYPTGQVDMGVLGSAAPASEFKINLSGKMRISPTTKSAGPSIIIGHTEYPAPTLPEPYITGSTGHTLCLGLSTKALAKVYSNQIYSLSGTVQSYSDLRLKRNINNLETSLEKVLNLRPVRYDLLIPVEEDAPEEIRQNLINLGKDKVGFIAQETKDFIPEVVRYETETDLYTIDYAAIVPFLTKAIQEQQALIEELQEKVLTLEIQNATIGTTPTNAPKGTNIAYSTNVAAHILYQNSPNPFNSRTQIRYSIAPKANRAQICIYNMSGQQLKCIPIANGEGSIWIEGSDLQQGVYLYALLVDGNLVDMKKMVLTN